MITTWNDTFTVNRLVAGTIDSDGFYTDGTSSSFTMSATIMRLSAKDMLNLPEGQRTEQMIKIYTDTVLNTANITTSIKGDIVTYKGNTYEIMSLENWDDFDTSGIEHFKYVAMKIDPNIAKRTV